MEKFKISEPMPFIRKEGVLEGYIEYENGIHVLRAAGDFRQSLKRTEYDRIMAANALAPKPAPAAAAPEEVAAEEEEEVVEEEVPAGKPAPKPRARNRAR